MEKIITTRQWATVKRMAQSVQPLVQRKQRLQSQIAGMIEEYKSLDVQISGFEQGIKALCGGLGTEQLVCRVVTPLEGRFDKDGKQLRKVTYEPSSNVRYNAEANNYTILIPEPGEEQPSQPSENNNEEAAAEIPQEGQPSEDKNDNGLEYSFN